MLGLVLMKDGTYFVTITDANGCIISTSVVLVEPAAPTASAVVSSNYNGEDISCAGAADGAIDLTPGGGVAPYTFAWSNSDTTEDISGLADGALRVHRSFSVIS